MNLGPQKISNTYPYVINKSGSSFTLGDGGVINWSDAQVVTTSGTVAQTIGGVKTFTNDAVFNGNVGIGTATPEARLDVNGAQIIRSDGVNGWAMFVPKFGTNPFGANWDRFELRVDPTQQVTFLGNSNGGTGSARDLGLTTAALERMRITSGGNVGIGTSTPTSKLDVFADSTIARFAGGIGEWQGIVIQSTQSSASVNKGAFIDFRNENNIPVTAEASYHFTDGSSDFFINTTPAGSRTTDRRVEGFRIKGNGNVGIGTNNPTAKLDIQKTAGADANGEIKCANGQQWTRLNSNSAQGAYNSLVQAGDHSIIWGDSSSALELGSMVIAPWSNSANGLRITNNGNVGIGTSNPSSKLDVQGGINSQGDININGPNRKLILYSGGANNNAYIQADSAGEVSIYNGTAGVSKKFTVLSNGNVGIGTASPSSPLTIVASATDNNPVNNGLRVANIGTASDDNAIIAVHTTSANGGDPLISWDINGVDGFCAGIDNSDSDKFKIASNWNDLAVDTCVTIQQDGNVGIGTNSPTQKLDVHGSIKASGLQLTRGQLLRWGSNNDNLDDANITVINVGSDQTEMRFRIGDGNDLNDKFVFQQGNGAGGSSNTPMMTIQANGNVGIGTGNPAYKLDIISGGARILHPGGDSNLELGVGTTTNQYAYVDFVGDTTYGDYGLRVLRGNTGPNTFSNIYHRGTGLFQIGTQDGAPMMLITSGQERLTISGNGSTTVQGNLQVNGSISANGAINLQNLSVKLASDVSLTTANQYFDIISGSLAAGTWLVNTTLVQNRTTAVAEAVVVRITNAAGTITYATSIANRPNVANYQNTISATTIITLATATTIKTQAYTTILAAANVSVIRGGEGYSQLTAVRIG